MLMTSMRSSSGEGIVSVVLAVVMNKTFDRSNGNSIKWSRNAKFCSASKTSSSAAEGSPLKSSKSLSTSSKSISGFLVPASVRAFIILPGIAPM